MCRMNIKMATRSVKTSRKESQVVIGWLKLFKPGLMPCS